MKPAKLVKIALLLIAIGSVGSLVTWALGAPIPHIVAERMIDASPIRMIEIAAHNASVEILPTTDSEVQITLTGRNAGESLEVETSGEQLVIRVRSTRFFDLLQGPQRLTVKLPQKTYESLYAQLDNGNLSADSLEIETLRIVNGNGSIRLNDVVAQRSEIETDNGNITLSAIAGEIVALTDNGRISVTIEVLDRPMSLETTNGSITVKTAKAPTNVTLEVSTQNGTLSIFGSRADSPFRQVIGDGENLVRVRTRNGSITFSQ